MRKGLTELVLIIDKSSYMSGLESAVVSGFNEFLSEQHKLSGNAVLTTILYNDINTVLHDRINLKAASSLSKNDYITGGELAIYDAIGTAIHKTRRAISRTKPEYQPEKVLFVILKSGANTSSWQYTSKMIRELVLQWREREWEFMLFSTDKNAVSQARSLGIAKENTKSFTLSPDGITKAFADMSDMITKFRRTSSIATERISDEVTDDNALTEKATENNTGLLSNEIKMRFTNLISLMSALQKEIDALSENIDMNDTGLHRSYLRLKADTNAVIACCSSVIEEYDLLSKITKSYPDRSYANYAKSNMKNIYEKIAYIVADTTDRSAEYLGLTIKHTANAQKTVTCMINLGIALQRCMNGIADIYGMTYISLNTMECEIPTVQYKSDLKELPASQEMPSLFERLIRHIFS